MTAGAARSWTPVTARCQVSTAGGHYMISPSRTARPDRAASSPARSRANVVSLPPMATVAHRICPLCEATCGLQLGVDAGRITSVRGHDADVLSEGFLCPKGAALRDLH